MEDTAAPSPIDNGDDDFGLAEIEAVLDELVMSTLVWRATLI